MNSFGPIFTPLNTCRPCLFRLSLLSRRQFHKTFPNRARRPSRKASELPDRPARTRFAPSPTGALHLGSLRTALYNYLIAKRTGGQFILRIEDTDQTRTIPGAQKQICEELKWANLQWDEGPEVGGPYGPYIQSERRELYQEHAKILLETGHAYRCFCPPRESKPMGGVAHGEDLYDPCRSLSHSESKTRAENGEDHCVRLTHHDYRHTEGLDLTYGSVGALRTNSDHNPESAGPVLLKRDTLPTYHLANVVDDHAMHITHVIRGAEWFDSTPLHLALYKSFGWEPPVFAHVPLLTDETGAKYSKRHANNRLSVYKDELGALPEALNNFVALLGWNHGGKKDIMSMEDMVQKFRPNFTKGNTVVTMGKWDFLQRQHTLRRIQNGGPLFDELVGKFAEAVERELKKSVKSTSAASQTAITSYPGDQSLNQYVASILKANAKNSLELASFLDNASYFFFEPAEQSDANPTLLNSDHDSGLHSCLTDLVKACERIPDSAWSKETITPIVTEAVESYASLSEDTQLRAKFWGALRTALTFGKHGPGLVDTMAILGKDRTITRLERCLDRTKQL